MLPIFGNTFSFRRKKHKGQQDFEVWSRGQTNLRILDAKTLQRRLAETVAWCNSLTWPKDFRAPELQPNLFHQGPDDLLCDVGRSRQMQLRYRHIPVTDGFPLLSCGRLLVYFPQANLSDGAAEIDSHGFFDVFYSPPFDTWVTFFEDHTQQNAFQQQLLCYVPEPAVPFAELGINVNPEECILWLEQTSGAANKLIGKLLAQP